MNKILIIFILIIGYIYSNNNEYVYEQLLPPNVDPVFCKRNVKNSLHFLEKSVIKNSYICNPDNIISDSKSNEFDKYADKITGNHAHVMCWIDKRKFTNDTKFHNTNATTYIEKLSHTWLYSYYYDFDVLTLISIDENYVEIYTKDALSGINYYLYNGLMKLQKEMKYKIVNGKYDDAVDLYIHFINEYNNSVKFRNFLNVIVYNIPLIILIFCILICGLLMMYKPYKTF